MKVVTGVDIGNSTTEIVLVDCERQDGEVLATARAFTRGAKGSPEALTAAARLVHRTAAQLGADIRLVRVAPWRPVHISSRSYERRTPDVTPLLIAARSAATAAGDGAGVGRPRDVSSLTPVDGPVVALVGSRWGYAEAAARVNEALAAGTEVVGVLVEDDEAVLVANRLHRSLPVIDQVDMSRLLDAEAIALEARPSGQPLRQLTDPFWLAVVTGLEPSDEPVGIVVRELEDSSYAVVARVGTSLPETATPKPSDQVRWRTGARLPLLDAVDHVRASKVGEIDSVAWESGEESEVEDLFAVALDALAQDAHTRRGTLATDAVLTATLACFAEMPMNAASLEAAFDAPVDVAPSEAHAAQAGALSTPGVPSDAVVVDLGGGTVDVSRGPKRCVAAGAGELLTRVAAQALAVPAGTAEYAKRGPALHVEEPQVIVDENGGRSFLEAPAPSATIGALCVHGPVGLAAFNRSMALSEWRAWRTTAKAHIIGRNVARALETLGIHAATPVVLVGGAAGDDEAVTAVSRSLPIGSTIGRGNVAGSLGHRFAVAYGLAREGTADR